MVLSTLNRPLEMRERKEATDVVDKAESHGGRKTADNPVSIRTAKQGGKDALMAPTTSQPTLVDNTVNPLSSSSTTCCPHSL